METAGVRLSGVTINRVTGINAKFIHDNKIGEGAIVEIIRSGDVIPKIVKVVKPVKPSMPSVPWVWDDNGVHAIAVKRNKEQINELNIKHITFFLRQSGVEGINEASVLKLVEGGLTTLKDIVWADIDDIQRIPGLQGVAGQKIHRTINRILKVDKIPLATYMSASGVFGKGMGRTRLEALIQQNPGIMKRKLSKSSLYNMAMMIPGFSSTLSRQFAEKFPLFVEFAEDLKLKYKLPEKPKSDGKFAGEVVVFTGFRDRDLERRITSKGGKIGSSVTKSTTRVVYKGKDSSKYKKAITNGIPTYTQDEFMQWMNL